MNVFSLLNSPSYSLVARCFAGQQWVLISKTLGVSSAGNLAQTSLSIDEHSVDRAM